MNGGSVVSQLRRLSGGSAAFATVPGGKALLVL